MKVELGLKAQRSRHPYIRELGKALMGKSNKLKEMEEPKSLRPKQAKLISQIKEILEKEQ